jgi:DNA ligase-1
LKVREDKGIEEATEAGELADLYRKQEAKVPARVDGVKDEVEEDGV